MFDVFRSTLTVQRKSAGQYVNGIWQSGSQSSFTIQASVQPTSPKELDLLPEGRKQSQAYTLYTDTQLALADSNNQTNSDIVLIDSEKYVASAQENWQNGIINHFKYVVTKQS